MSLLHSFYCWGQVSVILISTVFFVVFGIMNWQILAVLWALVPLTNVFYFSKVPIASLADKHGSISFKKLFSMKMFWFFMFLMVVSGASEQAMSQWASAFAESELGVSKTIGDLAGPCVFAAGILWPGTLSLAAANCSGGTAMFALLALAGDLGCSLGPTVVGIVSAIDGNTMKTGLLTAAIFPILVILYQVAIKATLTLGG